MENTKI
ncbi:hypothetical protein A2U01_0092667, partial [Trifolium medium]|nr:hypothetical protein [Trifolium medium]